MGHRRKAREYALQGLYMYEMRSSEAGINTGELRDDIMALDWLDQEITDDIRDFTISLINGVLSNLDDINTIINRHSKNWKLERLTAVDKSILRLCIFEMLNLPEIPVAVTINEGIELGKIYGGKVQASLSMASSTPSRKQTALRGKRKVEDQKIQAPAAADFR